MHKTLIDLWINSIIYAHSRNYSHILTCGLQKDYFNIHT